MHKIQFQIGDGQSFTPSAGTNILKSEEAYVNDITFMKEGGVQLFEGVDDSRHYTKGLILLNGQKFNSGEKYTITY